MENMIATIHLQVDSAETAATFAYAISKLVPVAAQIGVDLSKTVESRVLLGATEIRRNPGEFVPNA